MSRVQRLEQGPVTKNKALTDVELILSKLLRADGRSGTNIHMYVDGETDHFIAAIRGGRTINLSLALKHANFEYFFIDGDLVQRCKRYLTKESSARLSKAICLSSGIPGRAISDIEERAIHEYTTNDHFPYINALLRGKTFDDSGVVFYFILAMLAISACNKNIVAGAKAPFHYRYEEKHGLPVVMREYARPGKIFKRNGMISTTAVAMPPHERFFPGHQKPITEVSMFGRECETLYPPSHVRVMVGEDGVKTERFVTGVAVAAYDHYEVELALTEAYRHLRKPYRDRQERVLGIERPNHALAHHVRGVCIADAVIAYFKEHAKSAAFREFCSQLTTDDVSAIKIMLAFSRTGRESEIAFVDNPVRYQAYLNASVTKMRRFLTEQLHWPKAKINFYADILRYMDNPDFFTSVAGDISVRQKKGFLNHIISLAHRLDLPRCYTAAQWDRSLAIYGGIAHANAVVEWNAEQQRSFDGLRYCALDLLIATGDQVLFDCGTKKASSIDAERFIKYNRDVDECYGHCSAIVENCIEQKAPCHLSDADGEAVSHEIEGAMAEEKTSTVEKGGSGLEKTTKPVKQSHPPSLLFAKKVSGLFDAVLKNNIVLLRELIVKGADVNHANSNGLTPLMLACQMGRMGIAKALINAGAIVTMTDIKGKNALSYALEKGWGQLIKLLKNHGASQSCGIGFSHITLGL
ncbi:MAG: SidE phosphodiesterase domain-containing protein [Coxiellaceae bacterium]|nr:SidE phosphodiesterase domain-containing protein [Coxiellaceae bacterium]